MKTSIYKSLLPKRLSIATAAVICSASLSASAQLSNCNAFIQGKYVEVGVNYNGAYGSSAAAPAGYHPHVPNQPTLSNGVSCTKTTADSNLGFVADPAKDGWGVAAPGQPLYMGDYFVPGVPFEGWSIMAGGMQANFWNGGASAAPPVGANVRYYSSGSRRATEWEGIYDSLLIIQRSILDTANTYFTIRVKIKNLAHTKRKDVYYFRSVDPDNDQTWAAGGYATDNFINYQTPNAADLAVVSAWGRGYDTSLTYLGMGTKDKRAMCFINNSWPSTVPINMIHSRSSTISAAYTFDSLSSIKAMDLAIGLVFKIDSLPAFDSTLLRMAYMFGGPDDISGAMDDEGLLPEEMPLGIKQPGSISSNVKTSPNPFRDVLRVSGVDESDRIILYNLQGAEISANWTNAKSERTMNATELPVGVYIIRVENANGQLKFKQVLQHN